MAQRKVAQRKETDVVMPQDNTSEAIGQFGNAVNKSGQQFTENVIDFQKQRDRANMNDYMADANLQMTKITGDWRIANESDPTNQEALGKLHTDYDKVLGQYTNKVGVLSRGDWMEVTNKLKSQYQLDNLQWGQKQSVVNMTNRTNSSIKKDLSLFAQMGRTDEIDNFRTAYANRREVLEGFASVAIGAESTTKLLENYKSDAMFSYLMGVAENNPDKAIEYFNRAEVKGDLGDEKKVLSVEKMLNSMKKSNEQQIEVAKVNDRLDILSDITSGQLNWQDSIAVINKVGAKDPRLAEAMMKNVEGGDYFVEDIDNESFMELAKNIFSSKDNRTISDFLVNSLADKNISRDRLGILVYAAKERGKELNLGVSKQNKPAAQKRGFWDIAYDITVTANPLIGPLTFFNTVKRAKQENAQGEQIVKIANDEVRKQRIINDPSIPTISVKGELRHDKYGTRFIQYPDGSVELVQDKQGNFTHKENREKE